MQKTLLKSYTRTKVTDGIIATLAFFELYKLPLSAKRVWELLYKVEATFPEVESELVRLSKLDVIVARGGLFALTDWEDKTYAANQIEITKRWNKIRKYYWLLSSVPYVESVCVINSVAMGNADSESDIDFFVITRPGRLYFVRTWIILLFKMLGVYKNRKVTIGRFCFGFYMSSDRLSIKHLNLPDEDPYMNYWMGTLVPITGERTYERFMKENRWVYSWLPNFDTNQRLEVIHNLRPRKKARRILEYLFAIPSILIEPYLRRVHIKHTFNLPENHWKTSSTIADKRMLKLHALDPRKDLRQRYYEILNNYR